MHGNSIFQRTSGTAYVNYMDFKTRKKPFAGNFRALVLLKFSLFVN